MRRFLLVISVIALVSCSKTTRFQLVDPARSGIDFANVIMETDSLNVLTYEYIYNGAGVGTADFNNDGLQDLFFAGNQVSSKAYLNLGGFRFRNITSYFEGLTNDQWYSGVAIADVNNDGLPDVYLTSTRNPGNMKCKNRLWINQGMKDGEGPFFKEMAEQYGIADEHQSVAAAFFDYDRDGDLDLYLLNNVMSDQMNTGYHSKINDGSALNNDRLYRNNGNGTFTDVSSEAGITYEGYGMGLAISDINRDGYPDIYISNDFTSNDVLYLNQKDGTFRNEIEKYISYQSKFSKGNAIADINNDGNPDIYTLDILPQSYAKRKQTINGFSYSVYQNDKELGYEHQYLRNMLHINNGFIGNDMLPFSETGQMIGISQSDWSWSPLFADFDNDGDKDLIVSNGYPRDLTDKDWTSFKVTAEGSFSSNADIIKRAPEVKIPNMAFMQEGKRFEKTSDWLPDIPSFSYGAAYADLDNDGDLDYIVSNLNDKALVLKNTTSEKSGSKFHFLEISLKGKSGNTTAIGAKVELWDNGKYQFVENFPSRGYASSVTPVIHFGLGDATGADSLRVTWPDGLRTSFLKDLKADTKIEIEESGSVTLDYKPSPDKLNHDRLFQRKYRVIDYLHEQNDFNDFGLNQRIIPHKFSQIGPCIAAGDIDNDGSEDIVIGATGILPTRVFLNRNGKFISTDFQGLTGQKNYSESDLAITDMDGDGKNDIVAVAGGYENSDENDYTHYVYENRNGSFVGIPLPVPKFQAAVVRACDFNHDGNKEIFIGSRVKREYYPYASHSWLIFNDKGRFTVDSTSQLNLGMVTDAIWTDYDRDGWEDLLVTREGNSVVMLKNINGTKLVPLIDNELSKMHGFWYSVASGDFNKDGYEDYIIGNLGENAGLTISEQYPLRIYAIDLDGDGIKDPLMTAYWPDRNDKMTEYPVNYYNELVSQSAFLGTRMGNYTFFSYLSFRDILGEEALKRVEFNLTVNTLSSYILWNEKGRFRWEKLPDQLQTSPVTKMIVDDFNVDGWSDILAGGNDYSWDPSTGDYDANKGVVLINNGKRNDPASPAFHVLEPAQSGLLLQGMVGSLLSIKGDTSLIIAGINREPVVVYSYKGK